MKDRCPTCGGPTPHSKLGVALHGHIIVARDSGRIELPRREALVMATLMERWPRPVSKDSLIFSIYGGEDEPDKAEVSLHTHISKLRQKIRAVGLTIRNSRHMGYWLEESGEIEQAA